jgi:hypothetical protein
MIISSQAVQDQIPSSSAVESSGSEALTSNSLVPESREEIQPTKSSPICESTAATNQQYGERCKAASTFLTADKKPQPNFPPAPLDTICLEPGWADELFDFDILSPFSEKGTTAARTVKQISLSVQEDQPGEGRGTQKKKKIAPEKRKVITLPFCRQYP